MKTGSSTPMHSLVSCPQLPCPAALLQCISSTANRLRPYTPCNNCRAKFLGLIYACSLGLKFSATVPNLFVSRSVATTSESSSPTFKPFPVYVADHLAANLILGRDWLALCQAAASRGTIIFESGTYEVRFNCSGVYFFFYTFGPILFLYFHWTS
jgi:hypothetical protein